MLNGLENSSKGIFANGSWYHVEFQLSTVTELSIEKNNTRIMVVLCKIQCTDQNFDLQCKIRFLRAKRLHNPLNFALQTLNLGF